MPKLPLVVDLDGTLIRNDITLELCLEHVKQRWLLGVLELLFWFLSDKAKAKDRLTNYYMDRLNWDALPIADLIDTDVYKQSKNRALVSGSDHRIVKIIAERIGGFSVVQGSTAKRNLTGKNKAKFLEERFEQGFAYIGDSNVDVNVWQIADLSYGYNVSDKVIKNAKNAGVDLHVLSKKSSWIVPALKGMRLHQWSKNMLLAVIPLLNLASFQAIWILWLGLAFIAFGAISSATYLVNDLLDIQADRLHRTKRKRPFANGSLSVPTGAKLALLLVSIGFGLAAVLDYGFAAMLLCYTIISSLYSLRLKRVPILDVFVLSFLFCWRILAGGVLFGLSSNAWFMLALGFFFLALALGKRAIELFGKTETQATVGGRGYVSKDYGVVYSSGVASSFASVIIMAIYALLSKSTVIQSEISVIIILVLLLYWKLRFWLLVGRNQVNDDPIVFALKDWISLFILILLGLVVGFEQLSTMWGGANG